MGDKTAIEWTDATWNPVSGCSKVSQGCKHCYAERVFPRVYGQQTVQDYHSDDGPPRAILPPRPRRFTDVQTHPDRLEQPLKWRQPRRIFVNSMSDLFHEDVPDDFILRVFDVMRRCAFDGGADREHQFQVLTKRPRRMLEFAQRLRFNAHANDTAGECALYLDDTPWPPITLRNVWLGVSVEDQPTFDERWPYIKGTPAAVRFISAEPLLGIINLGYNLVGLDWVIAGGESGPHARPSHPDWFRSLRDQCVAAGVPFFFKQWGEYKPLREATPADAPFEPLQKIHAVIPSGARLHHSLVFDPESVPFPAGMHWMERVGKKNAGRELDGRTWDEYPR